MYRSLEKWSKAADIDFRETPNAAIGSAQIRVRFEEGTHSDQFPFDGPSGTLAHAFFPLNNRGIAESQFSVKCVKKDFFFNRCDYIQPILVPRAL